SVPSAQPFLSPWRIFPQPECPRQGTIPQVGSAFNTSRRSYSKESARLRLHSCAMSTSPWDCFVRSFLEGYFEQFPTFGSSVGRHEFDGRLPDWSAEALAEKAEW